MKHRSLLLCSVAALGLMGATHAIAQTAADPQSGVGSPAPGAPAAASTSPSTGPVTQSATAPDGGASPQAAPTPLASQPGGAPEAGSGATASGNEVSEVVVTGVRASLQSAQNIRKNSTDIVDSIVAEDIGKLPDNTVGDALQRVTGVQITRAAGEASSVEIRGLPNVTSEINGRDIFTTTGRSVALSDIPAELVSGVDVYKTTSPELLEGGIAGLINIRLRRPFDFNGLEVAGTIRGIYGDQRNAVDPNASLLISDRWNTGLGDVGALLSLSYQKRRYLDETAFNFVSFPSTDPTTGASYLVPQTSGDIATVGNRERYGANFSSQWRPLQNLELYAEGSYQGYRNTISSNYFIGIPAAGAITSITGAPGAATNGTALAQTINTTNAFTLTSDQGYEDRTDTIQGAFGGRWTQDRLTVTSDLSYTYSIYRQRDVILDTRFNAPDYTENFNNQGTPFITTGTNVTDASNFDLNQLFDDHERQTGSETAFKIDGVYETDLPYIKSFTVGVRYAFRTAGSQATPGDGIPAPTGSAISAAGIPGLGSLSPADFLSGDRALPITQWFNASASYLLSNTNTLRALFGQPAGEQPYDPLDTFHLKQDSYAGYVKANYGFDLGAHPVTGDFGVRLVDTEENLLGYENPVDAQGSTTASAGVLPVRSEPIYKNVLPSFNGKVGLTDNLFFRVAAGKTVTYPDFASLNPSLSLTSAGATLIGSGTQGNSNLRPVSSTNVDTALEWYFAKTGSLTATYFHRSIQGYIQTYGIETPFTIAGGATQTYLVNTPENTGAGELQGLELGYQQFYDFLPWYFKGFGTQINVTYIDAHTQSPPDATTGLTTSQALANVSRYSLNAIGLYERGPLSLRVAYNWRSKYVEAFNAGGDQPQTIISDPVGDLDLSGSYAITPKLVLTLDAANLTREITQDYFGTAAFPRNTNRSDRTIELGLRFRL
ncbi:MAG: TonB-dependent receptor [Caulobacteraceae bacterium]